ncbi:MAG: hypothetical protein NC182_07635 [Prevotella sp.]|nr:hypothetical protein [Staphylococcus sp.]MCM1351055.1 hypothetical protein [Prevotella sp.]
MNEDNQRFFYQYKALTKQERQQIERIQKEYACLEKTKDVIKIKTLHRKVKLYPQLFCIGIGLFGCLVFGFGMSMILVWKKLFLGTCIGCVGIFIMLCVKQIYMKIHAHQKEKYAPLIVELSTRMLEKDK